MDFAQWKVLVYNQTQETSGKNVNIVGPRNISYKSSQQIFFFQVVENREINKVKFCVKFGQV